MKITLSKPKLTLPLAYQSILQGTIYALLSKNEVGDKYHNVGYQYNRKVFKCFVFSQLFGNYSVSNNMITFHDDFYFYLSSQDEQFMQEIYQTLNNNQFLILDKQKVSIKDIHIFNLTPFAGKKTVTLRTLSPILIYSTHNRYSTYYKPSDGQSQQFILQNIHDKSLAYGYPLKEEHFKIVDVHHERQRMVKFKNCIYRTYLCELEVEVNFETLLFIYNCGLSSKGSCGFGMIEVLDEKSHLSI